MLSICMQPQYFWYIYLILIMFVIRIICPSKSSFIKQLNFREYCYINVSSVRYFFICMPRGFMLNCVGAKLLLLCLTLCDPMDCPQGFCRQEYWSGLPCPSPGDLPDPGIEHVSLASPALAGGLSLGHLGNTPILNQHFLKLRICSILCRISSKQTKKK